MIMIRIIQMIITIAIIIVRDNSNNNKWERTKYKNIQIRQ